MPVKKLRDFLNREQIKYVSISHSPAFTAPEIAASAHVPGRAMAKTVVIRIDGELALCVLPASAQINFDLLRTMIPAKLIELADESEFRDVFPGCELGAMPPVGQLYGLRTFVEQSLASEKQIAFNAGSHTELIRMDYRDFERLAEPTVLHLTEQAC